MYVTGLPTSWTWPKLKDHCRRFGDTNYTNVDGRGGGVVDFEERAHAVAACKASSGSIRFRKRAQDCCRLRLVTRKGGGRAPETSRSGAGKEPAVPASPGGGRGAAAEIWTCGFARPAPRYLAPRAPLAPLDQDYFRDSWLKLISDEPVLINDESTSTVHYPLREMVFALPGRPEHDPGDFPRNIRHWLWCIRIHHEERFGAGEWALLCQLDGGLYALLLANECASDGFRCNGASGMSLTLAPDPADLVFFAMTDHQYLLYERTTAPAPCWAACDAATAARRLALAMLGHRRLGAGAGPWARELLADGLAAVGQWVWAAAKGAGRDGSVVAEDDGDGWHRAWAESESDGTAEERPLFGWGLV